jgi:hypothetical protein
VTSRPQFGEAVSPPNQLQSMPDRPGARPLSVTLLIIVVLIFTGLNLLRLILTIQSWKFFASLLPVSPWYLALTGLVWSLLGCALIWGLWLGRTWAPAATRFISGAYVLYYWIDRLFAADRTDLEAGWPFTLAICLVVLLWILWIFTRRRIRNYFGDSYDDRFEHSTIARDQSQRPPGRRPRTN